MDFAITDNASSMKKAFCLDMEPAADVEEPEEEDDSLRHDTIERMTASTSRLSCFAHTLQLVVNDGLKINKVIFSKLNSNPKLHGSILPSSNKTPYQLKIEEFSGERRFNLCLCCHCFGWLQSLASFNVCVYFRG